MVVVSTTPILNHLQIEVYNCVVEPVCPSDTEQILLPDMNVVGVDNNSLSLQTIFYNFIHLLGDLCLPSCCSEVHVVLHLHLHLHDPPAPAAAPPPAPAAAPAPAASAASPPPPPQFFCASV